MNHDFLLRPDSLKPYALATALGLLLAGTAQAQSGGYRGPQRDGIHPSEPLANAWPAGGPRLLWRYPRQDQDAWNDQQSLGAGFNNVLVTNQTVYVSGLRDDQGQKHLYGFAFSLEGELKWSIKLGKCLAADKYAGPRATPEYAADRVYFTSGLAELFCVDARTGQLLWTLNTTSLGHQVTGWGYNLSPLLTDGKLILPLRRSRHALVALDPLNGQLLWSTPVWDDATLVDSSPVRFSVGDRSFVLQHLFRDLFAVDLATGKLAWKLAGQMSTIMTPVFANGDLFLDLNYRLTQLRPKIVNGQLTMETIRTLEAAGGLNQAVVLGQRLYWVTGSAQSGSVQVTDLASGKLLSQSRCELVPRSLISADGKLFSLQSNCTAPANGKGQYREQARIQMFAPSPEGLTVLGSFKPAIGTKEVYVAPVIAAGRLFHRHGSTLAVYDLRPGSDR